MEHKAMEYKTMVTRIGLAKITNAMTYGETIRLTHMAFGDGGGTHPDIHPDMDKLVRETYRGRVNSVEIVDDTNIKVSRVIPSDEGGFYIREVGVFDEDGDLIAVGAFPQTYKPTIQEGATKDVMANMIIAISSTEAINLEVDPHVIVATTKDVADLREELLAMNIRDEKNMNEYKLIFRDNIPYFRVEKGDE